MTDAFNRYEQALVTNDVSVLDELFFNSPNTIRYGAFEESIGYQAIQEFRLGRNPTNERSRFTEHYYYNLRS